jgi:hypothetical protein
MTLESDPSVEHIIDRLKMRHADAVSMLDVLDGYRQMVDVSRSDLENPQAVNEYVAFFADLVGRLSAECERLIAELPSGVQAAHVDTLREIAATSASEQRRCLVFRDKWINKPLPHERLRPLLNDISITTRDQLTAFRELSADADRLQAMIGGAAGSQESKRSFDRRALFTRLFRP